MKLEYKIVILSVFIGVFFIIAEMISGLVSADTRVMSRENMWDVFFEPLTTDQGLFFNITILLICFIFGILLAKLINVTLKSKGFAKQKDLEKKMILDFIPEIVVYVADDHTIQWASRSMYLNTGLKKADVVGKPIRSLGEILYPMDVVEETILKFEEKREQNIEVKNNKNEYWRFLTNPIKDGQGNSDGYVILAINITDSKRYEEMKRVAYGRLENNIEQFATVVDNIRNPLSSILLLAEMSTDKETSEKMIQKCNEIEEVISKLDEGWAGSEEIRNFLKKHL